MKYRIIKEVDGNQNTHYEVHFYKKFYGILFSNWIWAPYEERVKRGDYHYYVTKKFATMEEAEDCVRKHDIGRSVVAEGVIGDGKLK
jgi:hypothetical protein